MFKESQVTGVLVHYSQGTKPEFSIESKSKYVTLLQRSYINKSLAVP